MAQSIVRTVNGRRYVSFEFSCSCGATGLAHSSRAAAERSRVAHMRRRHTGLRIPRF